jgi:hypothetical protein
MPMGRVLRRVATLLMLTLSLVMEGGEYHFAGFERSGGVSDWRLPRIRRGRAEFFLPSQK